MPPCWFMAGKKTVEWGAAVGPCALEGGKGGWRVAVVSLFPKVWGVGGCVFLFLGNWGQGDAAISSPALQGAGPWQ